MIFDKATYVARQGNADNYTDETDNNLVKIGVDKHLTPQLYGRISANVNIDFQKMKNNRVYCNFIRSKAKALYYTYA